MKPREASAAINSPAIPTTPVRLCVGLAILLLGYASTVSAQPVSLHGVWAVTISPRNCATNQPLPAPAVRTLLTFHGDGTSTESVSSVGFAAGQRAIGHGTWRHVGGTTFVERTVAMILFDGGMFQAGWQLITRTITMTDANNYTSSGPSDFYNLNRQLYFTACATSVGERVQ